MLTERGKSSQPFGLTASGSGHTLGGCRPRCSKHHLVRDMGCRWLLHKWSHLLVKLVGGDAYRPATCDLQSLLQQASMGSHWCAGLQLRQAAAGNFPVEPGV